MKIKAVSFNNHKKSFCITTQSRSYSFPYSKLGIQSTPDNSVVSAYVDKELANEGFTYLLKSGEEGSVHIDQILDYNQDPTYMRNLLLYKLTLEAQKRVQECHLSKREIIRRMNTSASQFYRLLDQTNYRKTIDQMLALLSVLECEVDILVHAKTA